MWHFAGSLPSWLLSWKCFLKKNRIHAGVWLWRHTRWQGDSVECTLPRALPVFSPVRPDASVPANGPGGVSAATKGETQSYRPERGSSISDARPESHLWMGVYHYLLLFFSSFLPLSLLLTVFDRIRQVNEKQRGKNNCSPSFSLHLPQCVCLRVCAYLSLLTYDCPVSSGVPVCQKQWWYSMRVMRS